jgi:hypothetical protein
MAKDDDFITRPGIDRVYGLDNNSAGVNNVTKPIYFTLW